MNESILQRCRTGDGLAWEQVVRTYQNRVFGLALHYVQRPEDARDVAQEVFIKIYSKIHLCPPLEQFLPWLLTVTRNAALDHLRRRAARPAVEGIDLARSVESPETSPALAFERKTRRGLILEGLKRLSELSREMIVLKEIQGLSLEEIASLLKLPLGTVKSRSHRARFELAEQLVALRTDQPVEGSSTS